MENTRVEDSEERFDTSELRLTDSLEKCFMKLTCNGMTQSHFQHLLSPKTDAVSGLQKL